VTPLTPAPNKQLPSSPANGMLTEAREPVSLEAIIQMNWEMKPFLNLKWSVAMPVGSAASVPRNLQ